MISHSSSFILSPTTQKTCTTQTTIKKKTGALVKVKTTDIALLGSAWKLKADQVQLKKLVGSGVHGHVYRGALHSKWEVAVKLISTSSGRNGRTPSTSLGSHISLESPRFISNSYQGVASYVSSGGSYSSSKRHSASLTGSENRISSKLIRQKRKSNQSNVFNNSEVKFLMRTRHERLVMFLGAGTMGAFGETNSDIFLVTEWMDGGNLAEFYWNKKLVSWRQRLQILMDCLEGLAYLHLLHKSVHCDLKSPNILLDKSASDGLIRAKLGDFGLSRIFTYVTLFFFYLVKQIRTFIFELQVRKAQSSRYGHGKELYRSRLGGELESKIQRIRRNSKMDGT